ncbi:MAG: phosphoadenosine phosphosulfate reductase family protein, partial [Fastidiosipila sp.]|nr:phosphoadenosine phosphosulfate reductase family protein [Fastidiosipila sp.]
MWCNTCNIETNNEKCPVCGELTIEEIPTVVHWCANCRVPIIGSKAYEKHLCPICGENASYLASDIRPVFPEERLLVELLLEKEPNTYINSPVWVANNRYYIDGKATVLPNTLLRESNIQRTVDLLDKFSHQNSYEFFNRNISLFIEANKTRLDTIVYEAHNFIRKAAELFQEENIVISFSGGKDSTVTADLTTNALSNPYLVHIFGNTTLELPQTLEYTKRYREDHPQAIFKVAENKEQNFLEVCDDIGPPARMMRWCCSMFKTGPISRVINNLYRNEQILTFYGIRQSESVSRSKYNRIEDDPEAVKIQQQTVASPIFFWNDIEIWLYILTREIDFNAAYRLGYDRVGCWCCPNNNDRAQYLNRIYLPEKSNRWRDYLISFAHHIGKPDAETYIDSGKWKARQGGNGLAAADDVKIQYTNCTSEEHSKIYRLTKPMDDEFLNMLT